MVDQLSHWFTEKSSRCLGTFVLIAGESSCKSANLISHVSIRLKKAIWPNYERPAFLEIPDFGRFLAGRPDSLSENAFFDEFA